MSGKNFDPNNSVQLLLKFRPFHNLNKIVQARALKKIRICMVAVLKGLEAVDQLKHAVNIMVK